MTSDACEKSAISLQPESEFKASWWLGNGHAQTLYRKFRSAPTVPHKRERIELSDGDFIDIDWALHPEQQTVHTGTIVLVLHGLCGCSQSSYVLALQSALVQRGVSTVAMNFRGCSGESNRLARSYHSGASEDVRDVLAHLCGQFPDANIQIVGYSLGANVLLKYLGEEGESASCTSAVAVSTPFRLADCSRAMLGGASALYGRYFVNRLRRTLDQKHTALQAAGNAAELERFRALTIPDRFANIWEFDDLITGPLHGFASAADYYAQCSSANFLPSITVPTLLLQSEDDPIIPRMALPTADELPANVRLKLTERGGHVGFIAAGQTQWLEEQICHALRVPAAIA